MKEFIILTDSTTDQPESFFKESGVVHLPHGTVFGDVVYKDRFWQEISSAEFYGKIRSKEPVTTMHADLHIFAENVEKAIAEGKDALYIVCSNKLSGSYNTAVMVAAELMEKHPGSRVELIDTLQITMGEGLVVERAVAMQKQGASLDEVMDMVKSFSKTIQTYFSVDDLMHLKRGGRLSGASALVGTLMAVKPILTVDDEGALKPFGKVRGKQGVIDELSRLIFDNMDESTTEVVVMHGDREADGMELVNKIAEKFPKEKIRLMLLGQAVSAHAGIGVLAVVFESNK